MATLASTPTKDYVSLRTTPRDPGMSPSYRSRHCTPPRLVSLSSELSSFDSPMFTPSPLRQRPLFPSHLSDDLHDGDDLFLQSPYKLPALAHHPSSAYTVRPQPIPADDEEGSIFLASSPPARSPFLPSSSSQPLRTPVKQMHRVASRSALAIKHLNTPPPSEPDFAAVDSVKPASRVGIGTKRKSVQSNTTPVRQNTLTPLIIASAQPLGQSVKQRGFDRLAPLPPPKFVTQTPQTRAETDVYLKRQTATLTRLRLTDVNDTAEGLGLVDDDSECELDRYERVLFTCPRPKNKDGSFGRTSGRVAIDKHKTKEDEEVVEAISPGGHIIKRRARSRPLSAELLESVQRSPTSPDNHKTARPRLSGIIFPSVSHHRGHSRSNSSSSESASPQPRRRLNNGPPQPPNFQTSRSAMNRQSSGSSASLFFGPTITPAHSPIVSTPSSDSDLQHVRLKSLKRHSHAGSDTAPNGSPAWNMVQSRVSASPQSSPHQANTSHSSIDEDEDMFFNSYQDLSFKFSITEGTPSPKSRKAMTPLPIKYKPRDSGVVLSDEDMDILPGDHTNGMPAASTSVGTLPSDGEDDLVTPGVGPEGYSGWPTVVIEGNDHPNTRHLSGLPGNDADAFIMRMLTKTGNVSPDGRKRVPGTPVKAKKAFLGAQRPWQSAVAAKIALHDDWGVKKEGKVPRKSLPAALPAPGKRTRLNLLDQSTDSEKEEDSPSNRREKYVGLGLGRPDSTGVGGSVFVPRTRWLMRRSSSGAFSSGSESPSSAGTPTQPKGRDWHLPSVSVQFSPSRGAFKLSPLRSTSNSSNSSLATLNSPTLHSSRQSNSAAHTHISFDSSSASRRLSALSNDERIGRFERDFVELDELGSGEFGKVIKVRRKVGNDGDVFAVKKSRRFEGPRHRLRLREEADILRHLAKVAIASALIEGDRHPNVLGYIDSWEEDDILFIQTELCESGSLSRFLWEYGRVFPRLDEARVWKIIADLSNGLRFIHDAGVIHLDLKPSNVLITREGRFKIGDFGMASMWPRPNPTGTENSRGGFEREGDKLYLAPEVLQGEYSKAADVFSFGMTILETATNIVVPDQGDAWHRLRREDFSQVDLGSSPELLDMIKNMMRTAPSSRMTVHAIFDHPIVSRARAFMEHVYITAKNTGTSTFAASPLASTHHGFLSDILGRAAMDDMTMDLSA